MNEIAKARMKVNKQVARYVQAHPTETYEAGRPDTWGFTLARPDSRGGIGHQPKVRTEAEAANHNSLNH